MPRAVPGALTRAGRDLLGSLRREAGALQVLAGAGVIRPMRPDKLARIVATIRRWGRGHAAGYMASAIVAPDAPAILDELGTLTFGEVDSRTNRLAHALSDEGIEEGDVVGIMCRNHRGFVESTVAVAKLGAHALYLNTAFAGPQLTDVVKREKPVALIYDEEFGGVLEDAGRRPRRFVAWEEVGAGDGGAAPADPTIRQLMEAGHDERPAAPARPGRVVILTSGTTGAPKGVSRPMPSTLDPAVALLSRIPLSAHEVTHLAAPLFHSWGLAHLTLGMLLSSTLSLARRFEPENCLGEIERSRATALVVVPVMMQRILELPAQRRAGYDTSSLRVVVASGSALPGDLAVRWMGAFGENLYNLYGSTEVAWATIATPADMRAAPGTAGRPARGTVVKLYDDSGREVPRGESGRIFVGNEMLFEGYTGGGTKQAIDGLMATGDVGRMDAEDRLFVEGREDEMIVSGGENVFPSEVEDVLASHAGIAEAAAIGVEDERFGQRLRAFVVRHGECRPSEDELKQHVKSNLAGFKVPREIWFVDELPRNATGKVLKRKLRELSG